MNLLNCDNEGETAWLRFTLVAASSLIVILGPSMIASGDCDSSATLLAAVDVRGRGKTKPSIG